MNFEPTMLQAFKENPTFFALAFLLGAVGFVLLLVSAILLLTKKPGVAGALGLAAAVMGLLTGAAGGVGCAAARGHTNAAVSTPGLSDRDRERITSYGYAEAMMPLKFSIGVGALPLLAGAALGATGLSRRKKYSGTT